MTRCENVVLRSLSKFLMQSKGVIERCNMVFKAQCNDVENLSSINVNNVDFLLNSVSVFRW